MGAWFYEIRNPNNAVLKRDGGFATQDAAKIAGREDAKKMKNSRCEEGHAIAALPQRNCTERRQFL